jgi:hypothetical protein
MKDHHPKLGRRLPKKLENLTAKTQEIAWKSSFWIHRNPKNVFTNLAFFIPKKLTKSSEK